jgi:hypothetical protein
MPVKYSIVKERFSERIQKAEFASQTVYQSGSRLLASDFFVLVGLGRIELPTSPLSGVRSSRLSYRPGWTPNTGGAGRDRTGDLLSANQALSQLSYSPW